MSGLHDINIVDVTDGGQFHHHFADDHVNASRLNGCVLRDMGLYLTTVGGCRRAQETP